MSSREWSETHIIELIKRNGGGLANASASMQGFRTAPTGEVILAGSVGAIFSCPPSEARASVELWLNAPTLRPYREDDFPPGSELMRVFMPLRIGGEGPGPNIFITNGTLNRRVTVWGSGNASATGSASININNVFDYSSDYVFSSGENYHPSGIGSGFLDTIPRFYSVKVVNSGLASLVDQVEGAREILIGEETLI